MTRRRRRRAVYQGVLLLTAAALMLVSRMPARAQAQDAPELTNHDADTSAQTSAPAVVADTPTDADVPPGWGEPRLGDAEAAYLAAKRQYGDTDAATLVSLAEEAMTTLSYLRSRALATLAVERGGLSLDELTRAYRLIAVCSAQLDDTTAAEDGFLRLFALTPDSNVAMRLSPARRSAVLTASGFWSAHKEGFGVDVSYARHERQIMVHVRDPIAWAKKVSVWWRFGDQKYQKAERPVGGELAIDVDDIGPTDVLEVYAFASDEHGNVLMQLGREHDPHLFALSEEELEAVMRRDIRGGQTGSFALRLEELGVQVGVHGYASLELKPEGDDKVPSFDLHHATAMIRANMLHAVSVELAFEWEHLGLDRDDFYLPHAFLDVKLDELLVVRGGFFEVPVGAFNEYLYPDFLRITASAPLFSLGVVPALWSEVGVQLRGRLAVGSSLHLTYAVFVANGLQQHDATPTDGKIAQGGDIHDMRFNNIDVYSGDKGVGGRLGVEWGELDLGLSGYTGRYTIEGNQRLSMADADLSYRGRWLTVRTEAAMAFEDTTLGMLHKSGLYALVALRPVPAVEPYVQYDIVDLGPRTQRILVGCALYPFPNERATRNLRLKSEAGYQFGQAQKNDFVWLFQLTTGF